MGTARYLCNRELSKAACAGTEQHNTVKWFGSGCGHSPPKKMAKKKELRPKRKNIIKICKNIEGDISPCIIDQRGRPGRAGAFGDIS